MSTVERAKRRLVLYYEAKYPPGRAMITLEEAGESLAEIVAELIENIEAGKYSEIPASAVKVEA